MSICSYLKGDGTRCKAQAMRESQWCYVHNPDLEERRARNNSKGGKRGGRGRPQAELVDIKSRLSELAQDVLEGNVDKSVGAVTSQILNVYLRAIQVEVQVREQTELQERLERLEESLEQRGSVRRGSA